MIGYALKIAVDSVFGLVSLVLGVIDSNQFDRELERQLESANGAYGAVPTAWVDGTSIGDPAAPIQITVFADFQCPFCLLYTAENEPMIIEEYVQPGKVRLEFKHMPILGVESVKAALASECAAGQDRFRDYHHLLFLVQARAGQTTNERIDEGRFSDDNLRAHAIDLGLNILQFDACYRDTATLETVQADSSEARRLGITGVPNFVINGQLAGPDFGDNAAWRAVLDDIYNQLTE